ncbi:MAG TPA: hypothetical protein VFC99_12260, partial [Acidimicrobiia bacterium]|nr:hypothetical protein [Acidimicrobiia bacterium]
MNGPPAPALRDLVQETQQLLDSGDVDGAVERRDILAAAIPSLPEGHLDRVRAQALAASLYLVLVQRAKAAEVLAPFIRDGVHAEEQPIRAIAERDPAIAAAIASAGADALFRMRSYDDADRLVKLALELIGTHHVSALGIEARHRAMLHLRTLARAGRIEWRTVAKGGPARSRLEACLRELDGYAARLTHEQASSVEAFVLDIWAAVDWSSGRHHEARGRIYRAITLLERPGMRDRSRLAHAYYIAGKIESSFVN